MFKANKVIALIPARYGATRFPGKLMQPLGKRSVILTTYNKVFCTGLFDDVFVVTYSEIIHDEISKNGCKALYSKREHSTGSDRIAEAIEHMDCDIVINVQGDEPFMTKVPLEKLIAVFKDDHQKIISLASLKTLLKDQEDIQNPNNVKVITDKSDFALYFSRLPIPYLREGSSSADYFKHIGVYAFRKEALLNFSQLPEGKLERAEKIECIRYLEHGMKIKMIETDFSGVGIDTPEDLEKARKILKESQT